MPVIPIQTTACPGLAPVSSINQRSRSREIDSGVPEVIVREGQQVAGQIEYPGEQTGPRRGGIRIGVVTSINVETSGIER